MNAPRGVVPPALGIDRESAEGWRRWRESRHAFVPAPVVTLGQYRAMSAHTRALYDLHRAATHANLPIQETPMSAAVSRVMWSRIRNNALKHRPATRAGLMINGGGYQGKTETACEVAACFEEQWLALHGGADPDAVAGTRDLLAPVAYIQTPVTATPKSLCAAVLDFYGTPRPGHLPLAQLLHLVRVALRDHATRVLILDDVTRLRMHREADQDTLDLVRSLMSMNVTLVLIGVGIRARGLLREGRQDQDQMATQTERRFDLLELDPFGYDTPAAIAAWCAHLTGIETNLRLLEAAPGMLSDGVMPEYLYRRTNGVVGLLERLIEDGAAEAVETGIECITTELLDQIEINLGHAGGRDRQAGEVPEIPARRAHPARARARNTVFDDHGHPADRRRRG